MSLGKRDRAQESSSRLVKCFYCSETHPWKDMQTHCNRLHNGKTRRVPGTQDIRNCFSVKPRKRPKTETKSSAPILSEDKNSSNSHATTQSDQVFWFIVLQFILWVEHTIVHSSFNIQHLRNVKPSANNNRIFTSYKRLTRRFCPKIEESLVKEKRQVANHKRELQKVRQFAVPFYTKGTANVTVQKKRFFSMKIALQWMTYLSKKLTSYGLKRIALLWKRRV